MQLSEDDIHLKLLVGQSIELENVGFLSSPKVKDIISIGYSKYNHLLSDLLFDKSKVETLKDSDSSNFLLACYFFMQDSVFRKSFQEGIRLVFNQGIVLDEIDELPCLRLEHGGLINEDNFSAVQRLIKISNKIQESNDENEFNAGNSKAKEMIEKIRNRKVNKQKKKENINFHSLISGLSWKSTTGINIKNISELTVYQFYDGYQRLENIEQYNNILTGIYTGNINSKEIKMDKINWVRIIN